MNSVQSAQSARLLASEIKDEWARGGKPDARSALKQHPELLADRSAVVSLAHQEYWQRKTAGEDVDLDAFVASFPAAFQSSILRLLNVDQVLADQIERLDEVERFPWPEPGEKFADFALVRELGRGAFARVYLAREGSTGGRFVALKVSRQASGEARTLGPLEHPNIVSVLSAGHDEKTGFFAVCMPFRGSATLTDALNHLYRRADAAPPTSAAALLEAVRSRAEPDDPPMRHDSSQPELLGLGFGEGVMRVGAEMAEGLAYLHEQGVCHRDLKPSNVLLTPTCKPLLLDFNLSTGKQLGPIDEERIGGTLPYMAPEHIRAFLGEPGPAPGSAADIYSLGVILYELLTGRHPFDPPPPSLPRKEAAQTVLEHQTRGLVPLRARGVRLDARRARLVESCLSLEPADRPTSAELAAELRRQPWGWREVARGGLVAGVVGLAALGVLMDRESRAGSASPNPPVKERGPAPLELLVKGRKLLGEGKVEEARAVLSFADKALGAQAKEQTTRGDLAGAQRTCYLRGRANLLLGQPKEALSCLHEADRLRQQALLPPHGPTLASLAYCLAWQGDHREANNRAAEALKAGFRNDAVLNNMGYSSLQFKDLGAAQRHLVEAVRRNPRLQAARYNQARLAWAFYLDSTESKPRPPLWGLEEIETAIALGGEGKGRESPHLYYLAARLHATFLDNPHPGAPHPDLLLEKARTYATRAVMFGKAADQVIRDDLLKSLMSDEFPKTLRATEAHQVRESPPEVGLSLVDPITNEAD